MLKRGKQNKKLGDKVSVKMWQGMTMYSLTLEERATCPADCEQWDNCYGDNMPFAHRFDVSDSLLFKSNLDLQLRELNDKHKDGFVVRLHVLGDFYNAKYISQWSSWIRQYENLHVFGYTHHKVDTQLGRVLDRLNRIYKERFRIRFSDDDTTLFSAHVGTSTEGIGGIMCPEQTGKTDSCTTCGYCWSSDFPVVFIEH